VSKEGVAKTQEYRKPRKRVKLEERGGVVGKECTECGEWKALNVGFVKKNSGLGGNASICRWCQAKYYKENREAIEDRKRIYAKENREIIADYKRKWYEENKEIIVDSKKKWYEENKEIIKHYMKKYREENIESIRQYRKKYQEESKEVIDKWRRNNNEKIKLIAHRRRARKANLPDTLTDEKYNVTLEYFRMSCALTGKKVKLEKEHAIPISIGHGGTTFENCYPMVDYLNQSKGNNNIFEWFNANRQRFELSQEKFDKLIDYLSSANGMTVDEYRNYVYWCHANPRSLEDLQNGSEEGD
jgi:hypothetical protein